MRVPYQWGWALTGGTRGDRAQDIVDRARKAMGVLVDHQWTSGLTEKSRGGQAGC